MAQSNPATKPFAPIKRKPSCTSKTSTTNDHSMVTQAKNGIRKPKAYQATLEPTSIKSAFSLRHWK